MDLNQRAEVAADLFKLQGELFALGEKLKRLQSLHLLLKVETAKTAINEALEDFNPPADVPEPIAFPRTKHD